MIKKILCGLTIGFILTSCQIETSSRKDDITKQEIQNDVTVSRGIEIDGYTNYPVLVPGPGFPIYVGSIPVPDKIVKKAKAAPWYNTIVWDWLTTTLKRDLSSAYISLEKFDDIAQEFKDFKTAGKNAKNKDELIKVYIEYLRWAKENTTFFDLIRKPIYSTLEQQNQMFEFVLDDIEKKVGKNWAYNLVNSSFSKLKQITALLNPLSYMTDPAIFLGKFIFAGIESKNNLNLGNITYSGNVLTAFRVNAGKGEPLPYSLVFLVHEGKEYYCVADENGRFEFNGLMPGMKITFDIIPTVDLRNLVFTEGGILDLGKTFDKLDENVGVFNFILGDLTGYYETKTQTFTVGNEDVNDITTQVPSRLIAQAMSLSIGNLQDTVNKGLIMGTVCRETDPQELGEANCTVKLFKEDGTEMKNVKRFYYGNIMKAKALDGKDDLIDDIFSLVQLFYPGINDVNFDDIPVPHEYWSEGTTSDGGYLFINVPEGDYYTEVTHNIQGKRKEYSRVYFKARKGFFTISSAPYSSNLISSSAIQSKMLTGDFDGDKKSDIVRVCDDGLEAWLSKNKHKFSHMKAKPVMNEDSWIVADTNGDGIDELITGKDKWSINSSDGIQKFIKMEKGLNNIGKHIGSNIHYGDFNGDGADDKLYIYDDRFIVHPSYEGANQIVTSYKTDCKINSLDFRIIEIEVYENNWKKVKKTISIPLFDCKKDEFVIGDFNGDKIKDIIHIHKFKREKGGRWEVHFPLFLGQKNGRFKNTPLDMREYFGWLPKKYKEGTYGKWLVGDFDGNGFDDLLHISKEHVPRTWFMGVNPTKLPNRQIPKIVEGHHPIFDINKPGPWLVGDYNGDGKDDLIHQVHGEESLIRYSGEFGIATDRPDHYLPWEGYRHDAGPWIGGLNLNGDSNSDLIHIVKLNGEAIWFNKWYGSETRFKIGSTRIDQY